MCRDLAIAPFFGNSIACRSEGMAVGEEEMLVLGGFRAAQRVLLTLQPKDRCVNFCTALGVILACASLGGG